MGKTCGGARYVGMDLPLDLKDHGHCQRDRRANVMLGFTGSCLGVVCRGDGCVCPGFFSCLCLGDRPVARRGNEDERKDQGHRLTNPKCPCEPHVKKTEKPPVWLVSLCVASAVRSTCRGKRDPTGLETNVVAARHVFHQGWAEDTLEVTPREGRVAGREMRR